MTNFAVDVKLDGSSAGLAKAAAEAKKALDGLNAATATGAKVKAQSNAQAVATMRSDYQRMTQAREVLGVRSERRIQQPRHCKSGCDELAHAGHQGTD